MMKWIFSLLFLPMLLLAKPKGLEVVSGSAQLKSTGSALQIHTSEKAIVNWEEFSIGKGESVHFIQPNAQSAILNRVAKGITHIEGLLEANGKVYLFNPRGVVIGKEGIIRAASFIGSTLDLNNSDFLTNEELLFKGETNGHIVNLGKIEAIGGDVFLFAKAVRNEGTLQASQGTVGIAACQEVLLKPSGTQRLFIAPGQTHEQEEIGIENQGTIHAPLAELRADGNVYRLAINQKGVIEATAPLEKEGRVFLVADGGVNQISGTIIAHNGNQTGGAVHLLGHEVKVLEGALVDVSGDLGGGEVLIGGDYQGQNPEIRNAHLSLVETGAQIKADANLQGNGGKIIVWSDRASAMQGEALARGGQEGGDGGFVEVSGLFGLDCSGMVDTRAPQGKTGMLLLDPSDITINTGGPDSNISPCPAFTPTAATANIDINTITGCLIGNNVTISTASAFVATLGGTITVNLGAVVAGSNTANTLTLRADKDIKWNGGTFLRVGMTGTVSFIAGGDITIQGMNDPVGIQLTGGGSLNLQCNGNLSILGVSHLVTLIADKSLTCNVGGNLIVQGGNVASTAASCSGGVVGGTIGGNFSIIGGGGNNSDAFFQASGGNSIIFNSVGGNLSIVGGAGSSTFARLGTAGLVNVGSIGGSLSLTGGTGTSASASLTSTGSITFGPIGGSISLAGGTNTSTSASISSPNSIAFGPIGGNVSLTGSSTGSGAFAKIGSTAAGAAITFGSIAGNLSLLGGGNTSTTAEISQASTGAGITIGNIGGSVLLQGGSFSAASALIGLTLGNIQFGSIGGNLSLLAGGNAGTTAEISQSTTGGIIFGNIGGDVLLQGGSVGASPFALIGNVLTGIQFGSIGGNLSLLGGGGTSSSASAEISQVSNGGITFGNIGGNVTLQGGSAQNADALIGNATGGVRFSSIGRNVSVVGGSATGTFAQIGATTGAASSDVILSAVFGDVLVQANTGYALIGNGGNPLPQGYAGTVTVNARGNGQILASATASAGVGFLPFAGSTVSSPAVSFSSLDLTISGGAAAGANAFIGAATNTAATISIGLTSVATRTDLVLNPGASGNAIIGAFSSMGSATSNIKVTAGNLSINGGTGTGIAGIIANDNSATAPFNISILAENIFVGSGGVPASARIFASGTILAIANKDIFLRSDAEVRSTRGDVTLVVDNANPSPPSKGSGRFVMSNGALLSTPTHLRIFTSIRGNNSIQGLLNGVPFVPGPFLLNSSTEQWFTYFFSSFGGVPYTIFYKQALPEFINLYARVLPEMFQDLKTYDCFIYVPKCFALQYAKGSYSPSSYPKGVVSSFDYFCEDAFEMLQRHYRNYHTKYVESF